MIPSQAFDLIVQELKRQPLEYNAYRDKAGEGLSQAFGLVNRRCLAPDYSRQCWKRAYLYKLLLDFAEEYVDISFNSITVNQNYKAKPHKDKHNRGDSYLVAFGNYTGGDLIIHEGDLSGNYNINCNPIRADFSEMLHSVADFQGERYSLVYYWLESNRMPTDIPKGTVKEENGKYVFYRGTEKITNGLPHPLRGRSRAEILETAKKKKQSK